MKNLILLSVAGLALMTASTAFAEGTTTVAGISFTPSVGVDYQYSDVKNNTVDLNGADVHVGVKVMPNLGFEAGYFDSASNNAGNTKVGLQGYTLDTLIYLPVDASKKLELIGTAGIVDSNLATTTAGVKTDAWKTNGRIGAGAQYWLTDNVNVRGLVRYESVETNTDAVVSTIGVNYQF